MLATTGHGDRHRDAGRDQSGQRPLGARRQIGRHRWTARAIFRRGGVGGVVVVAIVRISVVQAGHAASGDATTDAVHLVVALRRAARRMTRRRVAGEAVVGQSAAATVAMRGWRAVQEVMVVRVMVRMVMGQRRHGTGTQRSAAAATAAATALALVQLMMALMMHWRRQLQLTMAIGRNRCGRGRRCRRAAHHGAARRCATAAGRSERRMDVRTTGGARRRRTIVEGVLIAHLLRMMGAGRRGHWRRRTAQMAAAGRHVMVMMVMVVHGRRVHGRHGRHKAGGHLEARRRQLREMLVHVVQRRRVGRQSAGAAVAVAVQRIRCGRVGLWMGAGHSAAAASAFCDCGRGRRRSAATAARRAATTHHTRRRGR